LGRVVVGVVVMGPGSALSEVDPSLLVQTHRREHAAPPVPERALMPRSVALGEHPADQARALPRAPDGVRRSMRYRCGSGVGFSWSAPRHRRWNSSARWSRTRRGGPR